MMIRKNSGRNEGGINWRYVVVRHSAKGLKILPLYPYPITRAAVPRLLSPSPRRSSAPPSCPRSFPRSVPPLCSPFAGRLRGLAELIVPRVVYVTPGPSGRVECTSAIVTYPHRGRATVPSNEVSPPEASRRFLTSRGRSLDRPLAKIPPPAFRCPNLLSFSSASLINVGRHLEWNRETLGENRASPSCIEQRGEWISRNVCFANQSTFEILFTTTFFVDVETLLSLSLSLSLSVSFQLLDWTLLCLYFIDRASGFCFSKLRGVFSSEFAWMFFSKRRSDRILTLCSPSLTLWTILCSCISVNRCEFFCQSKIKLYESKNEIYEKRSRVKNT